MKNILLLGLSIIGFSGSTLANEHAPFPSVYGSTHSDTVVEFDERSFEYKYKRPDDVYNLLIKAAEVSINNGPSPTTGRVEICITGRWPFNGCWEIGNAALACEDLLPFNGSDSFPNGVSCRTLEN